MVYRTRLMDATAYLAALGWTDAREREFAPFRPAGLEPGRVALEHNHIFRVLTTGGERMAEAAGRLKHRARGRQDLPVVGDWVALRPNPSGGPAQIRERLARRTWFSRKAAGRDTTEQVMAANIDTVLLVFGLHAPPNSRSIERYLAVARQSGAHPVVVLNKADLSGEATSEYAADAVRASGQAPVLVVSARTGTGLENLRQYLAAGQTLAMLGPSGVGKSSLANRLVGRELLPTGEIRDWDARGRHTSVHRQLVVSEAGGLIIDTPGLRELALWEPDTVEDAFEDISALGAGCRFADCGHDREPGCAVRDAVRAGQLDAGRHESYLKLRAEQQAIERRRDERARQAPKRGEKRQHHAYRSLQKPRAREGR
jgi:ribosome biogenesis GTPase